MALQPQGKGGNLEQFQKDFLSAHNAYRKLHGSPPLQLSRELCTSAQKWAEHLVSLGIPKHSDTENGENIYYKSISKGEIPGGLPVDKWYSEIKNYNFSQPGSGDNIGHFTQVVWKDSKELGVGLGTDSKGHFYVVGQYNPGGNEDGGYEKNVLPSGTA
ncbi:Golgi-associated plant pathogenesis-related protein 1-like [Bombina bombina]|uniref:Golgi-associated plant pathogenesis-related protein 1-like n=1 Tax=Bombina bombina TaxID=8345 RepID=UPI00235B261A|nr:Golgi-associated plant pathogenesis-related protein 1-like [Bombina bombina]